MTVDRKYLNDGYIEGLAAAYVNVSAAYDVTDNIEIFGAVENLLDRDPPIVPSAFGDPTQPAFFDMIGRNYRFGIRGRF